MCVHGSLRRSILSSRHALCVLSWQDPCFTQPRRVIQSAGNRAAPVSPLRGFSAGSHELLFPVTHPLAPSPSLLQATLMSPAPPLPPDSLLCRTSRKGCSWCPPYGLTLRLPALKSTGSRLCRDRTVQSCLTVHLLTLYLDTFQSHDGFLTSLSPLLPLLPTNNELPGGYLIGSWALVLRHVLIL